MFNQDGKTSWNSRIRHVPDARSRGSMTLDEFFRIGATVTLGSHTFEAEAIKAFASKYDPQPFHVDEEAAKKSFFGGLCASGWHTAATWMGLNLEARMDDLANWNGPGPARIRPLARLQQPEMAEAGLCRRDRYIHPHRDLHRPHCIAPGWRLLTRPRRGFRFDGDKVHRIRQRRSGEGGRRAASLPSPPVGEAALPRSGKMNEGCSSGVWRWRSPNTPHPTSFGRPPSPTRGLLRNDGRAAIKGQQSLLLSVLRRFGSARWPWSGGRFWVLGGGLWTEPCVVRPSASPSGAC